MQYVFGVAVAGLLGAILVGAIFASRRKQPQGWFRLALVLLLLAPLPFCLFGFAASFEPGDYHWAWRIIYLAILLGCIASITFLCWPRRIQASNGETSHDE